MTIHIDHFSSSCSFNFALDEGQEDMSLLEWVSCNANIRLIHSCPLVLNISSDSSFISSYVITPLSDQDCLLTDPDSLTSCRFNLFSDTDDIADDILDILEDEELAAVTARVIRWFCFSVRSGEFLIS